MENNKNNDKDQQWDQQNYNENYNQGTYDQQNQNYDNYNENYDQNQNYDGNYDQNYQGYEYNENDDRDDQAKKQDYLKKEIVDQGYDAARFAEFLDLKKPGQGIDVNLYTFDELYQYVVEFQNMIYDESQKQVKPEDGKEQEQKKEPSKQPESKEEFKAPIAEINAQKRVSIGANIQRRVSRMDPQSEQLNQTKEKMLNLASSKNKRTFNMHNANQSAHFSNKKVVSDVGNPKKVEEKGFLTSSEHLHFDITLSGDVTGSVNRKDQDFNMIKDYLTIRYPNALIPDLDKPQIKNKFTDAYKQTRSIQLTRFMDYCLQNETVKSDHLFEQFINNNNYQAYIKLSKPKFEGTQEIRHMRNIIPLSTNVGFQSLLVSSPDNDRVDAGKQLNGRLKDQMRIYCVATERLNSNFVRLGNDLKQVKTTVRNIRDCFKTLEAMELQFQEKFKLDTSNFQKTFNQMDVVFGEWEKNINKHSNGVNTLGDVLKYRAQEAVTIHQKIEYIQEHFNHADRKAEKLIKKRIKLCNEREIGGWENKILKEKFSEDLIKKIVISDKDSCMQLILPQEQHSIDDTRVFASYLTESLIQEMGRVKSQIALNDLIRELRKFNFTVRDNLKETLQITDLMDRKLKS